MRCNPWISFILLLVFAGCSSENNSTIPLVDNRPDQSIIMTGGSFPLAVTDRFPDGTPSGGSGPLGIYSLKCDAISLTAELVPLRIGSSTDVVEFVDITNFMTMLPCRDCAKINAVGLDTDSNLVVSIGIKHPFDKGDPSKQTSGKNRADLHLFNVEGYLVSDMEGIYFTGLKEKIPGIRLVNANGYSGYLDPALDEIFPTFATVHPYRQHFRDYSSGNFDAGYPMGFASVTNPGPSGNLVMPMGSDYDFKDYVIDLAGQTSISVLFVVGCTYGVSCENVTQRFSPTYRVPQFNKKAASEVSVSIVDNTLVAHDIPSTARLEINVLDMNNSVPVGTMINEMLADSSVKTITIDIPSVTANPVVVNNPTPMGGDGRDPLNPLSFIVDVHNSASAAEGIYTGLVEVLDSYPPGLNASPLLNGKDGIKRVQPGQSPLSGTYEIDEFATYTVFDIEVVDVLESDPPVAVISSPCPQVFIQVNSSLFFDGRRSSDDTPPVRGYEWDMDWDGIEADFTADKTEDHFVQMFQTAGDFVVGLRVKDRENQYSYTSVHIAVVDEFERDWYGPILLSSYNGRETTERDQVPSQTVAVDCDGVVHVVYKLISNDTRPTGLYYVNYRGALSTPPILLDEGTDENYQPTLRIDNQGNLNLVYANEGEIRYIKKMPGDTWGPIEVAAKANIVPGYTSEYPTMAIDYLGNMLVVFSVDNFPMSKTFLSYVSNDGSGWSTPVTLTERFIETGVGAHLTPNQRLEVDHHGRFHLVFNGWPMKIEPSKYRFWHGIFESGVWGPLSIFNMDEGWTYSLSSTIAIDGDLLVAYQQNSTMGIVAKIQRYNATNESWGVPMQASSGPVGNIPDLVVDNRGQVQYYWEFADAYKHIYYKTFLKTDNASTIRSAPEFEIGEGLWNRANLNICQAENGDVHIIFEDDRTGPGQITERNLYYIVWK